MTPLAGVPLVVGCLAVQGFFSGSEIAMVSANRNALGTRASEGHRGSSLALDLLGNEELLLGTCLIGTNLCVVTGTTLVSMMLAAAGVQSEWMVALAFVPFALVLGEALPKTVYQHHADSLAPVVAYPLQVAQGVFTPLLWMVTFWSHVLRRLTGNPETEGLTRSEILELLEDPDIDPEEQRMIRQIFEITETQVEEVMTPLVEVVAVRATDPVQVAIDTALSCGHSRIPVYRDRIDNIVGVLHAQDLLFGNRDQTQVQELARAVPYVPETKRVDDLLGDMRRNADHFAVVVDEYGGSVGVISVEDLLEEIVGEIRDERDRDERRIVKLGDGRWRIPGRAEIEAIEQIIGRELPDGDYETIAGLLLDRLGHIPAAGEALRIDDMVFRVEAATARAIGSVQLTIY